MATYKVLQDIEAEDKLLGPLTLKQFIFAAITIGIGFVEFKLLTTSGLGVIRGIFALVFFFPMAVFGFLAAPISRDQPNDIWLLARLRYLVKPRTRIWNQDGISQLVSITVPKKLQQIMTNGLNQSEVQSRLSALANTLDSRGWAIKNVNVNLFAQPGYISANDNSDRLTAPTSLPTAVSGVDVQAADDILDTNSNPTAHHLDEMVQASTKAHQEQVRKIVTEPAKATAPAADYWFLNQPEAGARQAASGNLATFQAPQVVTPGSQNAGIQAPQPTADEQALISKMQTPQTSNATYNSHLKTIQPLAKQQPATSIAKLNPVDPLAAIQPQIGAQQTINDKRQQGTNPAILNLANNDDLNVATIARQARHLSEGDDEVIISLH